VVWLLMNCAVATLASAAATRAIVAIARMSLLFIFSPQILFGFGVVWMLGETVLKQSETYTWVVVFCLGKV